MFRIGLVSVIAAGVVAGLAVRAQTRQPVSAPSPLSAPSPIAWAGNLLIEPATEFENAARRLLITFPNGRHLDQEEKTAPVVQASKPPASAVRSEHLTRATFTNSNVTGHPSLPFGTTVRVTNPRTGRQVVVKIGDRCRHCQINLSLQAARAIGLTQEGVGPVEVAVLN